MTDESKPRFDPRFNPAFQPGYEPGDAGTSTAAGSAVRRAPNLPEALAGSAVPAVDRQAAPGGTVRDARDVLPPLAAPTTLQLAPHGTAGDAGDAGRADPGASTSPQGDAPSPGPTAAQVRNPFLISLAGLALVFVGVGAWLFSRTYSAFNDASVFSSQGDFVALQAVLQAAPFVILLGVGTAVGVLFVFAARWHPKR